MKISVFLINLHKKLIRIIVKRIWNHLKRKFGTERFKIVKDAQTFKPEECHHCSVCDKCILKMDHHCRIYIRLNRKKKNNFIFFNSMDQ